MTDTGSYCLTMRTDRGNSCILRLVIDVLLKTPLFPVSLTFTTRTKYSVCWLHDFSKGFLLVLVVWDLSLKDLQLIPSTFVKFQILSTSNYRVSSINCWLIRSWFYQHLVDNQKLLLDSLSIRIFLIVDDIFLSIVFPNVLSSLPTTSL